MSVIIPTSIRMDDSVERAASILKDISELPAFHDSTDLLQDILLNLIQVDLDKTSTDRASVGFIALVLDCDLSFLTTLRANYSLGHGEVPLHETLNSFLESKTQSKKGGQQ